MSQPQQTFEQYVQKIKSDVYSMTGQMGTNINGIIDNLLTQLVQINNQHELGKKEILRLQDLLSQNKISYKKPEEGTAKVKAKAK